MALSTDMFGAVPAQRTADDTADTVRAAAAGNQQAWNTLVDQHLRLVWSITRNYRLADSDAADVVQTVWLRLLENIDRVRDPRHVAAWLATTTRRECLRMIALRKRTAPVAPDDLTLAELPDVRHDAPGVGVLREETSSIVHEAMRQLPPRWRMLLELLMVDDPPAYEVISVRLGMPIGSIGPTRGRALQRLRAILEPLDVL